MNPQSVLDHFDRGTYWPEDGSTAGSAVSSPADLDAAYQAQLALRALRVARGERPVGYKIGFTNRTIWERYQVFAPIWGTVWDTTLTRCDGAGTVDLAATCEPRLEPEVVFGIASTPPGGATLEQLFACVEWLAPGFEVVQSHRPAWKFSAADTVIDGALHARLLVGQPRPVGHFASSGAGLDALLAATRVQLYRGDTPVDEGHGADVLDGPLHALLHFVREMERCPGAPQLQPGDVVTTGTWTDAWPLEAGQTWRAAFDVPFLPLSITVTQASPADADV